MMILLNKTKIDGNWTLCEEYVKGFTGVKNNSWDEQNRIGKVYTFCEVNFVEGRAYY